MRGQTGCIEIRDIINNILSDKEDTFKINIKTFIQLL